MKDYSVRVSYQYIETLSDEAAKRYQSADVCFPLCRIGQLSACDVSWRSSFGLYTDYTDPNVLFGNSNTVY